MVPCSSLKHIHQQKGDAPLGTMCYSTWDISFPHHQAHMGSSKELSPSELSPLLFWSAGPSKAPLRCLSLAHSQYPHSVSSNPQRGDVPSSGHPDPTPSFKPEAALLNGMVMLSTNLGLTCPRRPVLLPLYPHPVLICPCRTHDGEHHPTAPDPNAFQELNFLHELRQVNKPL